jgi:hypothetical protein
VITKIGPHTSLKGGGILYVYNTKKIESYCSKKLQLKQEEVGARIKQVNIIIVMYVCFKAAILQERARACVCNKL